jgi:hypothetical protein
MPKANYDKTLGMRRLRITWRCGDMINATLQARGSQTVGRAPPGGALGLLSGASCL